jgi:light-regulated signal transduction histidine kinase (bacteriophytochrome)
MMGVYTQMIAKRLYAPYAHRDVELTEAMGFVVEGAARIAAQLHDLLAYLEVDGKGQGKAPVDCDVLLRQTLEQLQGPLIATGAVVTHDPLPTVEANATQLQLVFHHLLDNALKFCDTAPPHVHVWAERQEGAWRLAVRDKGIGIAPQDAATLFGFFKRLHPRQQYPGTGMGLAVCKKIVERHGGRIWVESEVGSGAIFYFTIREVATRPTSEGKMLDDEGRVVFDSSSSLRGNGEHSAR